MLRFIISMSEVHAAQRMFTTAERQRLQALPSQGLSPAPNIMSAYGQKRPVPGIIDRKSTRLNSSHGYISYAVFCLKKKKKQTQLQNLIETAVPTVAFGV